MKAKLYGDVLGASVIEIPFNEAINLKISKGWADSVNYAGEPYYVTLSHCETKVERFRPNSLEGKEAEAKNVVINRQLYIAVARIWINQCIASSLHLKFLKSVFEK